MFLQTEMIFGLLATLLPPAATTDYCSDVACKSQHTLCKYPDTTPGSECSELTGQGINDKQIEKLLHVHNTWRGYVAAGKEKRTSGGTMPQAANMGVMTWDEEMAKIAQRWALQCHFGHDDCRDLTTMRVGQNVAYAGASNKKTPNVTYLAFMWYKNEVGQYDAGGVNSFVFQSNTGHFTQWIWANSYKLGCGYTGYKSGGFYNDFLVCNYGPAGNVMRWPLYQSGKPCSACPNGTTCGGDSRYPNLCHSEDGAVPDTGSGMNKYVPSAASAHSAPTVLGPAGRIGSLAAAIVMYLLLRVVGC